MLSSSRSGPFPKNFIVLDGKPDSEAESLGAKIVRFINGLQTSENQQIANAIFQTAKRFYVTAQLFSGHAIV